MLYSMFYLKYPHTCGYMCVYMHAYMRVCVCIHKYTRIYIFFSYSYAVKGLAVPFEQKSNQKRWLDDCPVDVGWSGERLGFRRELGECFLRPVKWEKRFLDLFVS